MSDELTKNTLLQTVFGTDFLGPLRIPLSGILLYNFNCKHICCDA